MTTTSLPTYRPADPVRAAAALALAGLSTIAACALILRGFELSFSLCAMGGCSEPEDASQGEGLMLLGMLVGTTGAIGAPYVAGRVAWWRLPYAVCFAIMGAATSVTALGPVSAGAWRLGLFLPLVAFVSTLVPPRHTHRRVAAILTGGVIAQWFGGPIALGLALGLAPVAVAELIDDPQHPRGLE
jgi:hypothetical protein